MATARRAMALHPVADRPMPALHKFITTGDWSIPTTVLGLKPSEAVKWNRNLKKPSVEWLKNEYINTDPRDLQMVWFTNHSGALGCARARLTVHMLSENYPLARVQRCLNATKAADLHSYTVHYLIESDTWPCKPCFALLNITDADLVNVVAVFRQVLAQMWHHETEPVIAVHRMVELHDTSTTDRRHYWVTCVRGCAFSSYREMSLFVHGVLDSFLTPAQRACVAMPAQLMKNVSFPLVGFVNELFMNKTMLWIDPTMLVLPETEAFYEAVRRGGEAARLAYHMEHIIYLCDHVHHPLCPEDTRPRLVKMPWKLLNDRENIRPRTFLYTFMDAPAGTFEMSLNKFVEVCDRMFLWNVYENRGLACGQSWLRTIYDNGHAHPFFTMSVRMTEYSGLFEQMFRFTFMLLRRKSTGEEFVRFEGDQLQLSDEEKSRRAMEQVTGEVVEI